MNLDTNQEIHFSDQTNNANDPTTAYNIFIDKYTGLFDTCVSFKTIKGKAWLTKSLLRSINKKNKLYKQYSLAVKCKSEENCL